jgi:hypothetical protein
VSTLTLSIGACVATLDINDAVPEIRGVSAVNNDDEVARLTIYSSPGVTWRTFDLRPGESVNFPDIPQGQRKNFALKQSTKNDGSTTILPDFEWRAEFV